MSTIKLNLARKWRSRTFDEVVGQELAIRMLKNSLYLDHYFPVYLFSGQRGCGKTTAARIFSAAVNCSKLDEFQKNPKIAIPCLACKSCIAVAKGNHPDFIEIDAASHTGVDNVRQIIDAAALLPLLGRKKIYLIDEAHMLSKAAFNAFLKILEEPPDSVFFILATTDPQKIIETVKSRCFQILFKALQAEPLIAHLVDVCSKEEIPFDREALQMVCAHTEGSVRDALNLLEQVRFAHRTVNREAVLAVLGQLDEDRLLTIFEMVLENKSGQLIAYLHEIAFESFAPSLLWDALVALIRAALKEKYGVAQRSERLKKIVEPYDVELFISFLQMLYDYEMVFLKTRAQHAVLEHVLLKMCYGDLKSTLPDPSVLVKKKSEIKQEPKKVEIPSAASGAAPHEWQGFLQEITVLDDPLVLSVFRQGKCILYQEDMVTVRFPENFSFFNELLASTKGTWQPLLEKCFAQGAQLQAVFDDKPASVQAVTTQAKSSTENSRFVARKAKPQQAVNQYPQKRTFARQAVKPMKAQEKRIDVSDEAKWPKASIILKVFPGIVTEVTEDEHA